MESTNFEQYEKTLAESQFLGGAAPTGADKDAFEQVRNNPPSAESHPNTFAWFTLVQRFTDAVRGTWGGAAGGAKPQAGKQPAKDTAKADTTKTTEAAGGDDDFDPFAEGGDDDAAVLQAAKDKAKESQKKTGPIAKSLILFDVKPYEAETDLDALFQKILKIDMDGLVWKQDNKKEPIAYGVHKLVVGCVIEDEKVSVDDLQEAIQAFEEEVQSCDIAVFNKI